MIQMPRRSVTRFFIPLIDVLTLLFCIFLLMPLVKAPAESPDENGPAARAGERPGQDAGAERNDTPVKKPALQERLAVRVLEIDAATGKLYYHDPERAEVRNEFDAHELVARDRRAVGEAGRELYYEILYPRDPASPYPLREQRQRYDEWFKDVPHGWDIPGALVKGVKP